MMTILHMCIGICKMLLKKIKGWQEKSQSKILPLLLMMSTMRTKSELCAMYSIRILEILHCISQGFFSQ